jgi:hypothetical protein
MRFVRHGPAPDLQGLIKPRSAASAAAQTRVDLTVAT